MTMSHFVPFSSRYRLLAARQGFTLVEILVAISILAIVLPTVYGVFSVVTGHRERLAVESEIFQQSRILFGRFGHEIRGLFFNRNNEDSRIEVGKDNYGRIFLEMTTTASTPQGGLNHGIVLVRYQLIENNDNERTGYVLWREEAPLGADTAELMEESKMRFIADIDALRIRAYRNGAFYEEWNSDERGLPDSIEIRMERHIDDEREAFFMSAFDIPDLGS